MGMNTYARVHSSTPTQTMEIMTDTFPLDLYLQKEATCAYVRLRNSLTLNWSGLSRSGRQKSHLKSLWYLVRDLGVHKLMLNQDDCDVVNPADIEVKFDSFENPLRYKDYLPFTDDFGLHIYTDGSKHDGKVGCAYRIRNAEGILYEKNFRIPDRCSVYQAELSAIQVAAKKVVINGYAAGVTFFVDSQAAMQGLRSGRIRSQVVLDTINAVINIGQRVRFVWVKAHAGAVDNEAVDLLAKAATDLSEIWDTPIPKQEVKGVVLDSLRAVWNENWNAYTEARMSKFWYGTQDKHRAKEVCALSRLKLGRFVRIISGHNALNYYNHVLNPVLSPVCRLCKNADETFHHLATECPATLPSRLEFFGPRDILVNMDWKVEELLEFSYSDLINPLLDPNDVHNIKLVDTDSEGDEVG